MIAMREYGIISPKFWIGKTGRKLRAHPYAQRVALYLMTAPNADMTGVYYCPLSSILNDVGSPSNVPLKPLESPFEAHCEGYKNPFEGVRAAISVLEELGFCVYDVENEYVFVVEMARWQVAESLKATDNRVKGIKKYVESMPDGLRQRFINRYNDVFSLGLQVTPLDAPYKPLRSQEQEQEQDQEQEKEKGICAKPSDFAPDSPADGFALEQENPFSESGNVPVQKIVDIYNEVLGESLGRVVKVTPSRAQAIRARWRDILHDCECADTKAGLEMVRDYFKAVSQSNFLMGRTNNPNHPNWRADFDFLLKQKTYTGILEKRYSNGR